MTTAQFTLDCAGEQSFEGYTTGDAWNGWECPHFTAEVAREIVRAVGEQQTAHYDADADEFVFQAPGEEVERFGAVCQRFGNAFARPARA